MLFAIRFQAGLPEVRESESYRTDTPYAAGDVFRIGVESGLVKYYKNGTLLYTSTTGPTRPFLVDGSILGLNSRVSNPLILGAR